MRAGPVRAMLLPALVAVALFTSGCGGGSNTVVAKGVVTFSEAMHRGDVRDPVIHHPHGRNRECDGTGRYSDLVEGESLIIRNADGEVVGEGQLSVGTTTFRDASTGNATRSAPPAWTEPCPA